MEDFSGRTTSRTKQTEHGKRCNHESFHNPSDYRTFYKTRIAVFSFLAFFFAVSTPAQFTLVTGTITDTNGIPYACGTLSASIVNSNGQSLYLNGAQFSPQPSATKLGCPTDPSTSRTAGAYTVQLADNTQIKCGSGASIVTCATQTQWLFTINSSGVAPPLGTGPQVCTTQVTISGGSQTVSVSSCPVQSNSGGGSPATFNVKTFGAKGDSQVQFNACTLNAASPNLSCTGATFSPSDINKRANCGLSLGGGLFFPTGTTIASVVNSTTAGLSANSSGNTTTATCSWGTQDDVGINQAVTAWLAAIRAGTGQGPKFVGAVSPPPSLYFPSGGYLYCGTAGNSMINTPSTAGGATIFTDAPHEAWLISCDSSANPGGLGFFINQQSGGNALVVKNLSFTSSLFPLSASAVIMSGTHYTENLYFSALNSTGPGFVSSGGGYNLNMIIDTTGGNAGTNTALLCQTCNDEFHGGGSSNNGAATNILVLNSVGLNNGNGPRFINILNDEGNCPQGCFKVQNSSDTWILASALFGVSGGCLVVDGTSFVHLEGGICGVFGLDTNQPGLVVNAGGIVQSSDMRYVSTGTGKCIANSGIFYDNGGNTCESQFPIASGTSVGTAATLTLTLVTSNVNANCTVGDSLLVQGAGIAGYNGYYQFGITSVGVNTIGYTTAGSNLGALGAGGTAYCRNMQAYSGNLPKALLNNPVPNTCYITGTFSATTAAAPMCTFKLQTTTNISFIKASSTTTTACTVAPVVTISDGTVSETLTITTAKSIWDSSVDTSTGVGTTIFKPNGTITVTNTAGTCTTPPTNFGVSYNVAPILSN